MWATLFLFEWKQCWSGKLIRKKGAVDVVGVSFCRVGAAMPAVFVIVSTCHLLVPTASPCLAGAIVER